MSTTEKARMTRADRVVVDVLRDLARELDHFEAIEVPTTGIAERLERAGVHHPSAEHVLRGLGLPSRPGIHGNRWWVWPPHRAVTCPHCGKVTEVRR